MGGRSNNCKASLTVDAEPLCKATAVIIVGGSGILTGVVCSSFIGVGSVSSSSLWGVPSLSAAWTPSPEVSRSCLIALRVGTTPDLRVDPGCAGRESTTPVVGSCRAQSRGGATPGLLVEAIKTDWAENPRRASVHLEPVASEGGWEWVSCLNQTNRARYVCSWSRPHQLYASTSVWRNF